MRYLFLVAMGAVAIGCTSPTQPSTVSLKTCYTKPRMYCTADATRCWKEIDTYTVWGQCPAERID